MSQEFSDLKYCSSILVALPAPQTCCLLCAALSLVGEIRSILSISADIKTVGEILLKIIPTLEEVR